jgi:hypothetical protein
MGSFTDEEIILIETVKAARTVQQFLWGKYNDKWGIEEWLRMFRKRCAKLEEIKKENPHATIELKKRLLQTAALCVALIGIVNKEGIPWKQKEKIPTNLPNYKRKIKLNGLE